MKNSLLLALALSTVASLAGCKKKDETKKDSPTTAPKPGDPKPADPTPTPTPPPPAAADKELDLAPWGPQFAGFVAMAPEGTKVSFDDPSRQLTFGEENNYVSVSEAPFWGETEHGA